MTIYPTAGTRYDLHVRPMDGPDLTELIQSAEGAELDRLARELEIFADEFVTFVQTEVLPHVNTAPHRTGVPERITLVRGNNNTNAADFLLFIDGMVLGDGGVLGLIEARYALRVVDRGNYRLAGSWATPAYQTAH